MYDQTHQYTTQENTYSRQMYSTYIVQLVFAAYGHYLVNSVDRWNLLSQLDMLCEKNNASFLLLVFGFTNNGFMSANCT